MSFGVFLAVLCAAFLHAGWNALVRTGAGPVAGLAVMSLSQGLFGLALGLWAGLPPADVWPWLIASGAIHAAYKLFLAFAYEHGDLSRVYPIARGLAPMLVLFAGSFFLADELEGNEVLGVSILGAGILLMARGVFTNGESRRLLPFAVGSALATAGYSLVDGLGVRAWGHSAGYVSWMFALDLVMFLPLALLFRGRTILPANARVWIMGGMAGIASYGAYAIAVWAMLYAPIALVTALRETSILFAVLLGWLIFGERMDRGKALAALLIVAGVVFTRI